MDGETDRITIRNTVLAVKMLRQMLIVTAVYFHIAINRNVLFTNSSVVDNGLLHTEPQSNQTCMWYMNKSVSNLTKETSCKINDTYNDSGLKKITPVTITSSQNV